MITELPFEDKVLPVLVKRLTVLEKKVKTIENLFNNSYNNNLNELTRKVRSAEKTRETTNKSTDKVNLTFLNINTKKPCMSNKQLVRLIKPPLLPRLRSNTYIINSTCITDKIGESVNSSFNNTSDKITSIVFDKFSFKDKLDTLKDKTKNMLSMYEENTKKLLEDIRKKN
jgi:hypothetical protein